MWRIMGHIDGIFIVSLAVTQLKLALIFYGKADPWHHCPFTLTWIDFNPSMGK